MKPLDHFRLAALHELTSLPAVTKTWPVFEPVIANLLGSAPSPVTIFQLGDHLAQIFQAEKWTRKQSDLARGGNMWEILICWYLNLILFGSDAIVMRPNKKLMPKVIKEALTVKILGVATNKEADLIAFSLPTAKLPTNPGRDDIDSAMRSSTKSCNLTVIQSKTNWNDNAQAPMLWDIVYNAQNLRLPTVAVGEGGFSPYSFQNFSYAFMTVPTNTGGIGNFKASTTAVVRVRGLSGGNYWGHASVPGVADSISEFLGRNFQSAFSGGVQNHIATNILADAALLKRFQAFNF
jgi:hypothetical protein